MYLKSLPALKREGAQTVCVQLQAFSAYAGTRKLLEYRVPLWTVIVHSRIQSADLVATDLFFGNH